MGIYRGGAKWAWGDLGEQRVTHTRHRVWRDAGRRQARVTGDHLGGCGDGEVDQILNLT